MGRAFEYRKARKMKRWANMAKVFTRVGREISIAVKEGGADPNYNARLRMAIQNAKAANMPKTNVDNAIKKATAKDATDYQEIVYEDEFIRHIRFSKSVQIKIDGRKNKGVILKPGID